MDFSTYINFKKITKFDISKYFNDCLNFLDKQQPKLSQYFSGTTETIDSNIFENLLNLIEQSKIVETLFTTHSSRFKTTDFFELEELHVAVKTKLQTTDNLQKWLRSYRLKGGVVSNVTSYITAGKQQTLEQAISSNSNLIDEQDLNSVIQLNQVIETDWSIVVGGKELSLLSSVFVEDNNITTFFDSPFGENIFGIDLDKKLTIISNDLKQLNKQDTLIQTTKTLLGLQKEDLHYNKNVGIAKENISGINDNVLQYKMILSDITESFLTDDLFNGVSIQNVNKKDGNIEIDCIVSVKKTNDIKLKTIL